MIVNEDVSVQTLVKLGLTSLQAKIYLSIVVQQKTSAAKISSASKIARPDVYRTLPTLEEMGLVRKIIDTPMMYEATPLKEACDFLLEKKRNEYSHMQRITTDLVNDFNKKTYSPQPQSAQNSFLLISSHKLLLEKFGSEKALAKTSIDLIGDWTSIRPLVSNNMEAYQKALKRGVKIRLVTQFSDEKLNRTVNSQDNPLFEIRYLTEPVPMKASVYDGKRANVCVRPAKDNELVPSLWSDNPEFVRIIHSHFEHIWSKAKTKGVLQRSLASPEKLDSLGSYLVDS